MNICKHYVNNKCTNNECKYLHIDNICRNYFFNECDKVNCKFSHEYKLNNTDKQKKVKNTETFIPNNLEPSIRIRFNEPIFKSNEVSIVKSLFTNKNEIFNNILLQIDKENFKLWHGDSHLIADDNTNWKSYCSIFINIINILSDYFDLVPSATRLNYYSKDNDWKPYHHDAAALKPEKAKVQNITVGASFGVTREISFQSTHKNTNDRITINFPLDNGVVYAFGNNINSNFRHGIPQKIDNEINNKFSGRISIIIWGYSSLLDHEDQ